MINVQNSSSREQLTADKGGEFGSTSLPEAPALSLREKFDAVSVRVIINEQPLDVAVPNETFHRSRDDHEAIAEKIGGRMPTRAENRAVANYLLDREACYLLAQEESGAITDKEAALLTVSRRKWVRDTEAERRAEKAGTITEKETALLKVYRAIWVRDSEGVLGVDRVRVNALDDSPNFYDRAGGALVVCPSAESK